MSRTLFRAKSMRDNWWLYVWHESTNYELCENRCAAQVKYIKMLVRRISGGFRRYTVYTVQCAPMPSAMQMLNDNNSFFMQYKNTLFMDV